MAARLSEKYIELIKNSGDDFPFVVLKELLLNDDTLQRYSSQSIHYDASEKNLLKFLACVVGDHADYFVDIMIVSESISEYLLKELDDSHRLALISKMIRRNEQLEYNPAKHIKSVENLTKLLHIALNLKNSHWAKRISFYMSGQKIHMHDDWDEGYRILIKNHLYVSLCEFPKQTVSNSLRDALFIANFLGQTEELEEDKIATITDKLAEIVDIIKT